MNMPAEMISDDSSAQHGLFSGKRQIIFWFWWVGGIGSIVYSAFANFSPSELLIEYGRYVWVPLPFAFFVFLVKKGFDFEVPIPIWKKIGGVLFFLVMTLWFAETATIYSIPELVNRSVGEPFQAQTVVMGKSINRVTWYVLKIASFESPRTEVRVSEALWREVTKGDFVTVSGLQSELGRSIDTVTKRRPSTSQAKPAASNAETAPPAHASDGQSASQSPASGKYLLQAIEKGDYTFVDFFLNEGASPNATVESGGRPSPSPKEQDEVRRLVAVMSVDCREGATALQYAAMKGNIEITKLLLRRGANVHLKDTGGATAFFVACAFGHLHVAELLAKHGAVIDEPDAHGTTPLMVACLAGRTDVVKYLLDKGANVNARDESGNTPLLAAKKKALRPNAEIVKVLEERGAKE